MNYERNGTGFFCRDDEDVCEVYLTPKQGWTCLSAVHTAEEQEAPQMIARLGFRPSPTVFFAICEGWFDNQARLGLA